MKRIPLSLIIKIFLALIVRPLIAQFDLPSNSAMATAYNNGRHLIIMPLWSSCYRQELTFGNHQSGHDRVWYARRDFDPFGSFLPDWQYYSNLRYGRYPSICSEHLLNPLYGSYNLTGIAYQTEDDYMEFVFLLAESTAELGLNMNECESPSAIGGQRWGTGGIDGPRYGIAHAVNTPNGPDILLHIVHFDVENGNPGYEYTHSWSLRERGVTFNEPPHYVSIAYTPGGIYHIVWQEGDEDNNEGIFYMQYDYRDNWFTLPGEQEVTAPRPEGRIFLHPFVSAYGDSVHVVFMERSGDIYRIVRRAACIDNPRFENSNRSSGEVVRSRDNYILDWPVLAGRAFFTSWTENILPYGNPQHYEIYYRAHFPEIGNWTDRIRNLSNTIEDRSIYPHTSWSTWIIYDWEGRWWQDILFSTTWTEGNGSPYQVRTDERLFTFVAEGPPPLPLTCHRFPIVKSSPLDPSSQTVFSVAETLPSGPPLTYYKVKTGDSTPHQPYCEQRDGYIQYDQYSVDYGSELIYRLPYLHPFKYYYSQAILYYEQEPLGLPSQISQTFEFDTVYDTTVTLQAGIPETLNLILPEGCYSDNEECYSDNEVVMRIIGNDSVPAFLAGLKLCEFDGIYVMGGSQTPTRGMLRKPKDVGPISLRITLSPFSRVTTIEYQLSKETEVKLKVYNVTGRLVRTLIEAHQKLGIHRITWDGKDEKDIRLPDGFYFFKLTAKDKCITKKALLLK